VCVVRLDREMSREGQLDPKGCVSSLAKSQARRAPMGDREAVALLICFRKSCALLSDEESSQEGPDGRQRGGCLVVDLFPEEKTLS